ncbi:hypothetical protein Rhe02_92780 [Rhizocola hellebori]|uniref:Uncharacterized protein n=1 Tax=Rhizocola hellebori TaxID=1392758 RepID=A0A8J3QLD8_9ACTN|nr:hypothetical protein [Rhizocola hellebori]GIH11211.1 hypothetical protein Rhe02_92780 [Rhizocola hellebori]
MHFQPGGRNAYDRGRLVIRIDWDDFPLDLYGDRKTALRLTTTERHPSRRRGNDTWTDTPERPLHKQLGEIFTFIEQWADLLLAQRERERQQELERRRKRDLAEAEAGKQFAEQFRRKTIAARISEVAFAEDARAYAQALAASADGLEAGRSAEVKAWASWITRYADAVDPLLTMAGMPQVPNPSRDDLREFLPRGHWY